MKLITKAIEKKMPKLYEQDGKGYDAEVHVKLFDAFGGSTWFLTEYDPKTKTAFGWCCLNGDTQFAELGYVDLPELEAVMFCGMTPRIERDRYFSKSTLREAIKAFCGKVVA